MIVEGLPVSVLPPNHLVDDAGVGLDDLDDFGGDVLVHVVGDGDAVLSIAAEFHGGVNGLKEALFVDAGDDEIALVDGLRTLGRCADADGREGMPHRSKERGFLGQGPRIGDNCECIHLQAVVVMETKRIVLDDTRVESDSPLRIGITGGSLKALARARMAGVKDRHIILLSHLVDCIEQGKEVLLCVDVLLTMRA